MYVNRYLCDRDYKEFSALFTVLGVHEYIRYEDFNSLSSKIMQGGVYLPEVRGTFERCAVERSSTKIRCYSMTYIV